MDMSDTISEPRKKVPVLTIIAGATLALSLFTPYFLFSLPIMVTVGLSIAAVFRKEQPKPLPFVVGGLAIVCLLAAHLHTPFGDTLTSQSNAERYKDATWEYGSSNDNMRGTTSRWATLYSPTELNFDFPYQGDNAAYIQVSKTGYIILSVGKGQFLCHHDDMVAVKFDDGPVYNYPCGTPDNGDSTILYIEPNYLAESDQPKDPMDGLLKSTTMTVEAQFYQAGSRQLIFHVQGLDQSKL
jgi:hypothetical protein